MNKNSNDASLINQKNLTIEELFGVVYDELNDLVHYLAIRYSETATEVLMEKDEIVGELYEELWKGCLYYQKRNLPIKQMLTVLKVMLSNRVAELRYKYYRTHRKIGQLNISIDIYAVDDSEAMNVEESLNYDPMQDLVSTFAIDPASIYDSQELLSIIRKALDEVAQQIFDALIYGNEQLALHVWLSSVRSSEVNKSDRPAKLKPYHIASALCLPEVEVKLAMKTIKQIVIEVTDEFAKLNETVR